MPSTTPRGFPFPLDDDPISDGNETIQALADAVDAFADDVDVALAAAGITRGLFAARPAAGTSAPPFFYATDRHTLYLNLADRWAVLAAVTDDRRRLPDLSSTDETIIYTGSDVTAVEYRTQDGTRRARDDLAYTGADLSSVTRRFYDLDGVTVLLTVTEALTYTGGNLTGVDRTIA